MKRKLFIITVIYLLPFILVWIAFVMTAFSFNPREIFSEGAFWGIGTMYWLVTFCISPVIIEAINESK